VPLVGFQVALERTGSGAAGRRRIGTTLLHLVEAVFVVGSVILPNVEREKTKQKGNSEDS
jgi:hypothetical protein